MLSNEWVKTKVKGSVNWFPLVKSLTKVSNYRIIYPSEIRVHKSIGPPDQYKRTPLLLLLFCGHISLHIYVFWQLLSPDPFSFSLPKNRSLTFFPHDFSPKIKSIKSQPLRDVAPNGSHYIYLWVCGLCNLWRSYGHSSWAIATFAGDFSSVAGHCCSLALYRQPF